MKIYATAKAVADDLERWMADEPVSAWREPLARRARRWGRRNRTAVTGAAAALVVALLALSVGNMLIGRQRSVALTQRDLARGNLEQARRIVDEMYTQVADGLTDATGMDPYQRDILDKPLLRSAAEIVRQHRDAYNHAFVKAGGSGLKITQARQRAPAAINRTLRASTPVPFSEISPASSCRSFAKNTL